jgi:hypothetical protein
MQDGHFIVRMVPVGGKMLLEKAGSGNVVIVEKEQELALGSEQSVILG